MATRAVRVASGLVKVHLEFAKREADRDKQRVLGALATMAIGARPTGSSMRSPALVPSWVEVTGSPATCAAGSQPPHPSVNTFTCGPSTPCPPMPTRRRR